MEYQTIEEREVELWTISLCDTCTSMKSWAKKYSFYWSEKITLIDNQDSVGQSVFVLVKFLLEQQKFHWSAGCT